MALFGFGKKKRTQPTQHIIEKQENKPAQQSGQTFSLVNGVWTYNPEAKPETKPSGIKVKISTSSNKIWSESIEKFLARNDDAKLVRLDGHPEAEAKYSVENRCYFDRDNDDDSICYVTIGGKRIGMLPESAFVYARENEIEPEFLVGIVAQIEYGADQAHDVISIYIAS